MTNPLGRLLRPRSVAFVGASESPMKVGGRRFLTMARSGFAGPLHPVSPRPAVAGMAAVPDVASLPEVPDLVVVAIAPAGVPAVVQACADRRVGAVVVITGGFGEQSAEGLALERGFAATLGRAGSRLVGPNCAGLFSAAARVNVTGMELPAGPIGLITQSGNVLLDAAHRARRSGIGFSDAVSIGNGVDVRAPELLAFMLDDPATRAVLVYLEGWRPGEARALCDVVRGRPRTKPVIVLKPGDTEAGRRAVASHTGALAGEARLASGTFAQAGILQAQTLDEAWALAEALTQAPPLALPAIAVAADGGGHATLGCDALERAGLSVLVFGPALQADLAAMLPARCPVANPLDYAGFVEEQPGVAAQTIARCLADPGIGSLLLAGHFGGYHRLAGDTVAAAERDAAAGLGGIAAAAGKPVVVHSVYADDPEPAVLAMRAGGVPVLRRLDDAAAVLAGLHRWAGFRGRPVHETQGAVQDGAGSRLDLPAGALLEPDARRLLAGRGIALPPTATVTTGAECAAAAAALGGRVALKVVSAAILHKSDRGGVLLDVAPEQAAAGFERLREVGRAAGDPAAAVLVAQMAGAGTGLVLGGFRDPAFGPVVMLGLGGVLVEALGDVVFRLAPLTPAEALAMPAALRTQVLLDGYRGRAAIDRPALAGMLVALSRLLADDPSIAEIDLNPVIATRDGLVPVDVRVVMQGPAP
jgi:acyl-CoA synthetase (NDP forming)